MALAVLALVAVVAVALISQGHSGSKATASHHVGRSATSKAVATAARHGGPARLPPIPSPPPGVAHVIMHGPPKPEIALTE